MRGARGAHQSAQLRPGPDVDTPSGQLTAAAAAGLVDVPSADQVPSAELGARGEPLYGAGGCARPGPSGWRRGSPPPGRGPGRVGPPAAAPISAGRPVGSAAAGASDADGWGWGALALAVGCPAWAWAWELGADPVAQPQPAHAAKKDQ